MKNAGELGNNFGTVALAVLRFFSPNKRFKRSSVEAERLKAFIKRFLSVFKRSKRFLSVLSVLDAFRETESSEEKRSRKKISLTVKVVQTREIR